MIKYFGPISQNSILKYLKGSSFGLLLMKWRVEVVEENEEEGKEEEALTYKCITLFFPYMELYCQTNCVLCGYNLM